MKKLVVLVLLVLGCGLLPGPAQADFQKTKIAVLDFTLQGQGYETEDMGKIVAEWFITALVKVGRFEVVERGLLQKILDEQKLVMSGVVDENSATQLGKLLGVKVIISGSVLKLKNILEINARIIDVESASIIAAENVKSTSSTSLQSLVVQMSEKIIKNFPLEGYIVARSKDKVTIDLGSRAGVKKDMKFIVYREGNVIKHPKTGEVLDVEQIETGEVKVTSVRGKISEGVILKEEKAGQINYGQLVKSVMGPLKPIPQQVYVEPAVDTTSRPRRVNRNDPRNKANYDHFIRMLRSKNYKQKTDAAKRISRAAISDSKLLKVVADELLKGYQEKSRDRNHVDSMAWLCKALGASGQAEYKEVLLTVAKKARNRKLRKYAQQSLRKL